jgi:hypothetical protein
MKELNLRLTIDEANLVLEGLGNLPFAKVYALVAKIQGQASEQLNGQHSNGEAIEAMALPPAVKETSHAG